MHLRNKFSLMNCIIYGDWVHLVNLNANGLNLDLTGVCTMCHMTSRTAIRSQIFGGEKENLNFIADISRGVFASDILIRSHGIGTDSSDKSLPPAINSRILGCHCHEY